MASVELLRWDVVGRKGPHSLQTPSLPRSLLRYVADKCGKQRHTRRTTKEAKVDTADSESIAGTPDSKRTFMRVKEIADLLGVSESTVDKMCREGQIDAIKVRTQWRIPRRRLFRYLGIEEDDL